MNFILAAAALLFLFLLRVSIALGHRPLHHLLAWFHLLLWLTMLLLFFLVYYFDYALPRYAGEFKIYYLLMVVLFLASGGINILLLLPVWYTASRSRFPAHKILARIYWYAAVIFYLTYIQLFLLDFKI
ncbi:MAG TPA: hypothetical protein VKS21_03910 [Spirochaetota bacterium]|nr:hypothetical protein [Spirochaetota bacterium]